MLKGQEKEKGGGVGGVYPAALCITAGWTLTTNAREDDLQGPAKPTKSKKSQFQFSTVCLSSVFEGLKYLKSSHLGLQSINTHS